MTTGPGDARQPAVRGDGSFPFVAESEGAGAVIRWTGAGAEHARGPIAGRDPAWSPDGDPVACSSDLESVSQIFASPVLGREPVQVTQREYTSDSQPGRRAARTSPMLLSETRTGTSGLLRWIPASLGASRTTQL
jgi:hypothetical protein